MDQNFVLVHPTDRRLLSRGIDCILSQTERHGRVASTDLVERTTILATPVLIHCKPHGHFVPQQRKSAWGLWE